MKRVVLIGLLLVPTAARAECVAFLIPPGAPVAVDEKGHDPWPAGRADYILAYPAARLFHKSPTVVIKDGFLTAPVFAACGKDDLNVGKTGLLELRTARGSAVETVWAKRQDLIEVPYAYPDRGGFDPRHAVENRQAIERAATLTLERVESAVFTPPRIENERTFAAGFDRTWAATMEALADEGWQVATSDKGTGLVATKAIVEEGSAAMVCATRLDGAHRTTLDLSLKRLHEGTLVRVDVTFGALREDEIVACFSNGSLERALFTAIGKRLAAR